MSRQRADVLSLMSSGGRQAARTKPAAAAAETPAPAKAPRTFTPAEKALIRKVHGYMPAEQLLGILNERMRADIGSDAAPYTMEQLHAEIGGAAAAVPAGGHDWASLRQLLAKARREGVIESITEQVIDDFAVVWSLNARQVLRLKDILLQKGEGEA